MGEFNKKTRLFSLAFNQERPAGHLLQQQVTQAPEKSEYLPKQERSFHRSAGIHEMISASLSSLANDRYFQKPDRSP
jgi:hypothetical protein